MSMTFFTWDQLGFEKRGGKLVRKKLPEMDGIQPIGSPTPEETRLLAARDENSRLAAELAQVDVDEQAVADAERIEAENEILRHELQARTTTKGETPMDPNLKDLQALDALVAKASTGKAAEIMAKCDAIYERRVASIRKAEGCSAYEAYSKAGSDDVAKQAYALSKEMADRIARDVRAAAR